MIRTIDALGAAAARIGGETPRLDAEVLLAHHLGCARGDLLLNPERNFDPQDYEKMVERRAAGEPVAHITGTREFWSVTLKVSPAVLIPRPDTETLVEVALKLCAHPPARILDLGTGSGALLLACLSEWRNATGLDVYASFAAMAVAQENAQSTGLAGRANFRLGDWGEGLSERFDLILSNPPYIAAADPHLSQGDVRFEPSSALVAGIDGLDDIRLIIEQAPTYLLAGGWLLLEHGFDQATAVRGLLGARGFSAVESRRDLGGHERISLGRFDNE